VAEVHLGALATGPYRRRRTPKSGNKNRSVTQLLDREFLEFKKSF
jgi:hypothetical protein